MEQQSAELRIMADGAAATLAQIVEQRRATEQLNRQQHNFLEDRFAAAAALQSAIVVQEEHIAKQQQLEATIAAQKLCIEQHEARRANDAINGSYIFRLEQRIHNLEQSVQELRTEKAHAVERKEVYKEHWISKGQELRRLQARLDYERDRYYNRRNHGIRPAARNNEMRNDESDSAEPNVVHL